MAKKEMAPTKNKELAEIQREAASIVKRATDFRLVSDAAEEKAASVISWLAGIIKKIEVMRKFHTAELNAQVKRENALHKGYAAPFVEARDIMDTKMLTRRKEKQKKIDEENERIQKEAEKVAKKEDVPVEGVLASTEKKEIPKTVGDVTVKKRWTFKVTNLSKVDRKYLELDSVQVREDIRAGVREMKGIEIFEEENIATRGTF